MKVSTKPRTILAVATAVLFALLTVVAAAQRPSDPAMASRYDKAESLWSEAEGLRNQGTGESRPVARQKYLEAARLYRETGSKQDEAICYHQAGYLSFLIGESQKAIEYYNLALPLRRAAEDKSGEAITLHNIGFVYSSLGETQKALEYYNLALPLRRVADDKSGEAITLDEIAFVYRSLGENQKAIEYYNLALPLRRVADDKSGEAVTLVNIGAVHNSLGDKQKALEFYELGASAWREAANRPAEAGALEWVGSLAASLNRQETALEAYAKALAIRREEGNPKQEGWILHEMGSLQASIGENQKALEYYNLALPLRRQVGDKKGEAATLANIGNVYSDLGENQKALEYYNLALPLRRQVGDKSGEAVTLSNLMVVWEELRNPALAVYHGKQSVNLYQQLRSAIGGLDSEIRKTYLATVGDTYRKLADILTGEGRFFESQQVLGLLKEEEFAGYVRRDADEIRALAGRADLRPEEQKALARYEEIAGRVTEFGTRLSKLEELKRTQGSAFTQQAEFDDAKSKVDAANAAFRVFLEKELAAQFPKSVKKEIEMDRALQGRLAQWGEGTVALYTIAGEDRYRIILTTPKVQVDGKYEIRAADLNRKIFEFRSALRNPSVDPRPLGKELYDILVGPVATELAAAGAKTLVWSLDGTLRYIPLAALSPDGETYLAEKWAIAVVTSTARQNIADTPEPDWRVLGAGVTKESTVPDPIDLKPIGFNGLPAVESELRSIVSDEAAKRPEQGLLPGILLIDEAFDVPALENALTARSGDKRSFNVLHLATHFRLGADNARSFLLLGKNQALTLAGVSDNSALDLTGIEMVALSACETGFGTSSGSRAITSEAERRQLEQNNGAEVDSLATFIEMRGAKSVMATLWKVADGSTAALMAEFYRLKKENPRMTKAEALRQAQLAMISGRVKASGKDQGCRDVIDLKGTGGKPFDCRTDAPNSHPFFWSPFVLIGNWR